VDRKLGTFLGVYTPTILTILGVIMYLRFGWLVGHLGLARTLGIVLAANAITVVTTLSFSAIATNTRVGAGGAYYIISRSLGLEIGGAIGLPLFLSQAISVTLYAYGLAESLRIVAPGLPLEPAAAVIVVAVGLLAWRGAETALRAQIPLLGLVGLSLVALAAGALLRGHDAPLWRDPAGDLTLWAGFAIFFPAVTGAMAGLGLSGDLADPGRSIPRGSLLAVLTGLGVYLLIPVLLIHGASLQELRTDPLVWTRVALLGPWLILPGLWAAIFSSAVGSILGAPRTLHALAHDGLAPSPLGRGEGNRRDILPGLLVSVLIALAAVLLGNLNTVAEVVTMFFLTVYGTVNLAAALEALSGDPSWRPRLSVPWFVSLMGAFACGAAMLLINPVAAVVAGVIELLLWTTLSRREHRAGWGDARRGLYESLIRWALSRMARHPTSPRNWRPHVLVFVDGPEREVDLVRCGTWFSQGRGVVTVCQLVTGDLDDGDLPDTADLRRRMAAALEREDLVAFPEVDIVDNLLDGIVHVAQANGIAGLQSNTVLLGWPTDPHLQVEFLRVLRRLARLHKSLLLGRLHDPMPEHPREIHVWWGGLQHNGDLMLLLAWLLTRNPCWRGARIRVLSLASSDLARRQTERHLAALLPTIRMEAVTEVTIKEPGTSVADLIQRRSRDADIVFLGLALPEPGQEEEYAGRMEILAGDLPRVFFVHNASLFMGELLKEE